MNDDKKMSEIAYIVIFGVLAIFVPRALLPFLLNTEVPLAVIESGSMEPTIHVGDLVIIKGTSPREIKTGDIIVFRARFLDGSLTVHRVIQVVKIGNKIFYRTKGDANIFPDPAIYNGIGSVSESDIVGIVVARIPLVGYITLVFTKLLPHI